MCAILVQFDYLIIDYFLALLMNVFLIKKVDLVPVSTNVMFNCQPFTYHCDYTHTRHSMWTFC